MLAPGGRPTTQPLDAPSEPAGNDGGHGNGHGTGRPGPPRANGADAATNKQVKLLMDLARTRKMNLSVIERLCQETCGVSDVYGLTKSQASAVIDRLKQDNPAVRPENSIRA